MNPDERNEARERKKKEIQKLLEESSHPLADGIMCLTSDVSTLKEGQLKTQGMIDRLHKAVVGDAEFEIEGLVQKNEKSKEAHKATEKKIDDLEERLSARVQIVEDKVKTEVNRMKTIGAVIVVGWGVIGQFILVGLKTFFGRGQH